MFSSRFLSHAYQTAELFCRKGIMDSKGVLELKTEKNVETPV
jgi:hypothetical protein